MALIVDIINLWNMNKTDFSKLLKSLDNILSIRLALFLVALGVWCIALQNFGVFSNKRSVDVHIVDPFVSVGGSVDTKVRGSIDADVSGSLHTDIDGNVDVSSW